jgi:tellurite resistance protein TerC
MSQTIGWGFFLALVAVLLVIDLAVAHRKPHAVTVREAAIWSTVWVTVALLFGVLVWTLYGRNRALEYYTGWVIEKALSVDNLFVFVVLFTYFRVPARYEHRVLFWGVLGALVLRALMIWAGVALLEHFEWLVYVLGVLLVLTGIKLARQSEFAVHPERNLVLRLLRAWLPVTPGYQGGRFFVRHPRPAATPLLVVLLLVETTDLVFAVDSIPAILAITRDPFVVYTSNAFAILGLRSLYFLLAGVVDRFHYLRSGLAVILGFVGVKMLLADVWPLPVAVSLVIVLGVLAVAVVASLAFPRRVRSGLAPSPERV